MALRLSAKRPFKKLKQLKRLLPFGKPIAVKRSTTTYLETTGWQQTTGTTPPEWHGWYRTRFGSYKGRVKTSTPPQFYVHKPPTGLKARHRLSPCFTELTDGWYAVHFRIPPKDLDSGIIKLERILYEAFLLTEQTA